MTTNIRNAETYLETCALGYSASVQAGDADDCAGARAALHDAGIRLAAAQGNLDAAERAVAAGRAADGNAICDADASYHVVHTIDALLYFTSPNDSHAKEQTS